MGPSCYEGYEQVGSTSCTSGLLNKAECEPKSCIRSNPQDGGDGDCPITIAHGESCNPSCNSGYELVGSTTCTLGLLNKAKCKPKSCKTSNPENGGNGDCPTTLAHGENCIPSCDEGYKQVGSTSC